jgi:CreA protein
MLIATIPALADKIGHVDINFKLVGPDDKIVIEAFDDPGVTGVTCYYSHAIKGGFKGAVGLAEDSADASLDCKQTAHITLTEEIIKKAGKAQQVLKKRTSMLFKSLQVMRFYDKKRHTLVYLVYSDKILEGSPQNSISVVPVLPWETKQ